jgi:hypothetical protein
MIILVILVYTIIMLVDAFPLLKQKKTGELAFYMILITLSFVLSILMVFNVKIPSPAVPIKNIIMSIMGGGGK